MNHNQQEIERELIKVINPEVSRRQFLKTWGISGMGFFLMVVVHQH